MPRDIPVGNGRLLFTFDDRYQIRDVYFPHVGQENHAGNGPCRFGLFTKVPGYEHGQLAWTFEGGWDIHQQVYRPTEQEQAIKYKPKQEGRSKLGENADRLERGVTGMLKKFEKKFG